MLTPTQLEDSLRRGFSPLYVVAGDEPLQLEECCDAVRRAALRNDYTERELWQFDTGFRWGELFLTMHTVGLFATRRLLELRAPVGELHGEGAAMLEGYARKPPPDIALLLITSKLEGAVANSPWLKAAQHHGTVVRVRMLEGGELLKWLATRLVRAGLLVEDAGVRRLGQLVEGNMVAAAQAIEMLALLHPGGCLSAEMIETLVAETARFDVFKLTDALLLGDTTRILRILRGLRAEGEAVLPTLGLLARELRLLARLAYAQETGQGLGKVFAEQRIWESRQRLYAGALRRFRTGDLYDLLLQAGNVDGMAKGLVEGDPWTALEQICCTVARGGMPPNQRVRNRQ